MLDETYLDAASLKHVLIEEANPTPHWEHQTSELPSFIQYSVHSEQMSLILSDLMTGFIVAVVILLVLIFLVMFWMWK